MKYDYYIEFIYFLIECRNTLGLDSFSYKGSQTIIIIIIIV